MTAKQCGREIPITFTDADGQFGACASCKADAYLTHDGYCPDCDGLSWCEYCERPRVLVEDADCCQSCFEGHNEQLDVNKMEAGQ